METKLKTYLCKEGKEKFTIEAKDRNEAEGICEMFNAVVIKEIKWKTNLGNV